MASIKEWARIGANRPAPRLQLKPPVQEVFDSVKAMCAWRLGRSQVVVNNQEGQPAGIQPHPITLDEAVACLKRIRRSIERWNKEGGRRGYQSFVSQYVG